MYKADCPSCGKPVNVGPKPKMGQRFKCGSCSAEVEVVWLEPVELDWPFDGDDDELDEFDEEDFEEEY